MGSYTKVKDRFCYICGKDISHLIRARRCEDCAKELRNTYDREYSRLYRKKNYDKKKKIMNGLKINGCSICGYDKCNRALVFHHVIPKDKKFNLMIGNMDKRTDKLIDELHKCMLLCSNCHREIHDLDKNGMLGDDVY